MLLWTLMPYVHEIPNIEELSLLFFLSVFISMASFDS